MARTDNPNYGPGSISTIAKGRKAAIQADIAKNTPKKVSLLNAIMNPNSTPTKATPTGQTPSNTLNQNSAAIQDRVNQQKTLKKEVGGMR